MEAIQKFKRIEEINTYLQLTRKLADRYQKTDPKLSISILRFGSDIASIDLSVLPVITCRLCNREVKSDFELQMYIDYGYCIRCNEEREIGY